MNNMKAFQEELGELQETMSVVDTEYSTFLETLDQSRQQTVHLEECIRTVLKEELMQTEGRKICEEIIDCISNMKNVRLIHEDRSTAAILSLLKHLQFLTEQYFSTESKHKAGHKIEKRRMADQELTGKWNLKEPCSVTETTVRLLQTNMKTLHALENILRLKLKTTEETSKHYQEETKKSNANEQRLIQCLREREQKCEEFEKVLETLKDKNNHVAELSKECETLRREKKDFNTSCECKLAEMKKKLEALKKTNEMLETEKQETATKLETVNSLYEQQRQTVKLYNNLTLNEDTRKKELQEKIYELQANLDSSVKKQKERKKSLQCELKKFQKLYDDEVEAKMQLEKLCAEKENKIKSVEEAWEKKLQLMEAEKNTNKELTETLKCGFNELKVTIETMQASVSEKEASIQVLRGQKDDLEKQISQEKEYRYTAELRVFKLEKDMVEMKEISQRLQAANAQIETLRSEKENYEKEFSRMSSVNEELSLDIDRLETNLMKYEDEAKTIKRDNEQLQGQLNEKIKTLSNLQAQNHQLTEDLGNLDTTKNEEIHKQRKHVERLEKEGKNKQQRVDSLTAENKNLSATIQKLSVRKSELKAHIQEYEEQIEQMRSQNKEEIDLRKKADLHVADLEKHISSIQRDRDQKIHESNNKVRQLNEENDASKKKLLLETGRLNDVVSQLKQRIIDERTRSDDLQKLLVDEKATKTDTEIKNVSLEKQIEEIQEQKSKELKQAMLEKSELSKEVQKHKNVVEEIERTVKHLKSDLKEKVKEAAAYQNQLTEQKRKTAAAELCINELNRKLENATSTLARLAAKRKMQVQLYNSSRGDMLISVETELTKILKEKMETDLMQQEFIQCASQDEIKPDVPVLLLCTTASRLGVDVMNVLHGLTPTKKMALLIFHHKDAHALPSQASDRVLSISALSDLGAIFDMAFVTGKGIYSCSMNNNCLVSIVHFINNEGTQIPLFKT